MIRRSAQDRTARPPAAVRRACLAAGLLLWAGGVRAEPAGDLTAAVRRLGASSFAERHEAGEALIKAGAEALPYLREAASAHSPEVRYRAQLLLEEIERQLLEVQVARILNGEDVSNELPAWERYASLAGTGDAARRLFVEMLKSSPGLIASVGTDELQREFDAAVTEGLNSRFSRTSPQPEEIAAMLFVMAQPECVPGTFDAGILSQHIVGGRFPQAVNENSLGPPLKSLLIAWVTRARGGPPLYRLRVADRFSLPEGLAPAREILRDAAQKQEPQLALLFIARFGGLEDLHDVENLLGDARELTARRGREEKSSTEVGDLALATLWKLSQQNPAAHGFPNALKADGSLNAGAIGFPSEESRMKALSEWRRWRKQHQKAHLPPDGSAIQGWTT